ncbi:MAG: Ig-like domain-containing protein [Burkholderiaceae bacterium]
MALVLEKVNPQGLVVRQPVEVGRNRFVAEPGFKYRIVDDGLDASKLEAKARRVGDDLVVEELPDQTVVEFDGFFTRCTPEQSCALSMEGLGGAAGAEITPATQPVAAMTDGSFLMSAAPEASSITPMAAEGAGMGVKIGGLALVGVGLAAAGGGGGGGGGSPDVPPPVQQPLSITSSNLTGQGRPVISGTGTAGERLAITIQGADGTNVFYNVTVDANGQWLLNTANTPPLGGSMPADGLGEGAYSVTAHSATAGSVDATQALTIDRTPPAAPVITEPQSGLTINAAQAAAGVTVHGTAEAGSVVTVTWVGLTVTAIAGADGTWSAAFSGSQIAGSGDIRSIVATATDPAGNTGPASAAVDIVLQTGHPAAPLVTPVTGDDIVNGAEKTAGVAISGTTSPNASVTIAWGSATKIVTANAAGQWTANFASGEVPADGTTQMTLTARDGFGNTTPSTHSVLIDTTPPKTPTIAPVAGDDWINAAEHGNPVSLSGTTDPNTEVTINWGGQTFSTTSNGTGNWSLQVPAAQLPGAGSQAITVSAVDEHGNRSATTHPVQIDLTAPTLTITDNAAGTATGPVTFTFTFSEPVSDFSFADIAVTGGTAAIGDFSGSGTTYQLVVTPTANSTTPIGINVAADAAHDAAGNGVAATSATQSVNTIVPPTVAITDNVTGTATGPVTFTFTFSKPIAGFDASDVSVSNGTAGSFTQVDSTHYTLVVTPTGSAGTVTVSVAAGTFTDDSGSVANTVGATASQAYDVQPPTVTITDNVTGTATGPVTFTFTFSKPVAGFDASDVSVNGGTAGSFTQVDSTHYTLVVTPTGSTGTVAVSVAAGTFTDDSGSVANTAGATASQAYDVQPPTLTITDNVTGTATGPVTFTFTFSEPVSDFSFTDIAVTGGTAAIGNFSGSGTTYQLVVTPTANSTTPIGINVAADAAHDAAGNGIAAASVTQPVDTTPAPQPAPTVTIDDTTQAAVTNGAVTFTFAFDQDVTGFDASDLTVTHGTAGAVTGSGRNYSVVVTPDANLNGEDVSVSVNANSVTGTSSTGPLVASPTHSQAVDNVAPTQTLTSHDVIESPGGASIPVGGQTSDDSPRIVITLSSVLGSGETLHIQRDGADLGVATLDTGSTYHFDDSGVIPGSHTYSAYLIDAAGNRPASDLIPGHAIVVI